MESNELIRREFTRQRAAFEGQGSFFAGAADSTRSWLHPLSGEMLALDVACGAAHASEVAAPFVRQVVGIDLTPALLQAGAERLRASGVDNVLLQEGDAAAMPFLDRSFDLVFCRFAVHHFPEPERQIAEMARVCRPGGRVVIADMVSPGDATANRFDELHRLLDPSHARALGAAELRALVERDVGPIAAVQTLRLDIVFDRGQASYTGDGRSEVIEALRAELAGAAPTGFEPRIDAEGRLCAAFSNMVVHATCVRG